MLEDIICFFGHDWIYNFNSVKSKLYEMLEKYINLGYYKFLVGSHGTFDEMVFDACLDLKRKKYKHIKITKIIFTLPSKHQKWYEEFERDFETCSYNIEEQYFKNRITYSNKMMVNESEIVICYVDFKRKKSGAKTAVNYAIRQNKTIINLYDVNEDIFKD